MWWRASTAGSPHRPASPSLAWTRQVEFVITNKKDTTVFAQEFGLPVLDYTAIEAAKVLKDVESSANSAAQKEAARERLQPVSKTAPTTTQTPPTSTTPKPSPRPVQPPIERPTPTPTVTEVKAPANPATTTGNADADGSSVDGGVLAGIVLMLLGAVAAGFGWWYSNGAQLPF